MRRSTIFLLLSACVIAGCAGQKTINTSPSSSAPSSPAAVSVSSSSVSSLTGSPSSSLSSSEIVAVSSVSSSENSVAASSQSSPQLQHFSSLYFTLSLDFPQGFEVRDEKNSIRIAKAPFTDRAIGDDNAFFGITRYTEYFTEEKAKSRYQVQLKNQKASTIEIDGISFPTLSGVDNGRFEGDSAGRVFVVFFPKSCLEIIERPANTRQTFDPIAAGKDILSTMKFSK